MQALQQRRRCPRLAERLDRGAGRRQRIARQIDAIEVAIVLAAILQMIVDLQAGAERVRRRPGRGALAVDVEHEASDRHRRIAAIMDHFVPVLVAKLGHVHPERDQDIERMARRHRTLRQRAPQIDGLGLAVALAQQFGFEQIEIGELVAARASVGMIGDVVGGPDEIVERQDQRPVARMNDPRRDRKVLVAVSLAGSQFARGGHQELATFVWARWLRMPGAIRACGWDREPHIGEYDAKTNAICDCSQVRPRPDRAATGRSGDDRTRARFIARGFSAPDRRPWSSWGDFAEGKPEW